MSRLAIALISTLALTFTPGIYARGHGGGGHHSGGHHGHGGHHEHHGEHRHEYHRHHDGHRDHHGYYGRHGHGYYYGVGGVGLGVGTVNYYYGPGVNQHWCANHPGKCARWCANHPHRCSHDNGTYFIVSP